MMRYVMVRYVIMSSSGGRVSINGKRLAATIVAWVVVYGVVNLVCNFAFSNWIGTGLGLLCRVGIMRQEFAESVILSPWFGRSVSGVVLVLAIVLATSIARYIWNEWE